MHWELLLLIVFLFYFVDIKNKSIGCIHAGWKGAVSNIIENTIKKFKKLNSNNEIFASIGPCIGKESYEVDVNFYNKFILNLKKIKCILQIRIISKNYLI